MPINKKSDRGSGSGKNSSSNVEIHTDSYVRCTRTESISGHLVSLLN